MVTLCNKKKSLLHSIAIRGTVNLLHTASLLHTVLHQGPVLQQMWHDKDPSLLNGPERRT
jgi:hypothetical protein